MLTIEQVDSDAKHLIELYQCFEREWDDVEPLATTKNGKFVPTPIVALHNGTLVGGLVFTRFLSPITQQQAIWINAVFIKPEHRRQGISSRLIQYAEQLIQAMNEPELLVFAQIPALYSKLGWQVVETVDDHFVLKSDVVRCSEKDDTSMRTGMNEQRLILEVLTAENFYAICQLSVKPDQQGLVDSNAISMAEANFSDHAWMRGIYLGDVPIGFVMVDAKPVNSKFYLWRFMIDQQYQSLGLGKAAMQLIVAELKSEFNASVLTTSVVPAENGPLTFYQGIGFQLTGGYIEERELELKLVL